MAFEITPQMGNPNAVLSAYNRMTTLQLQVLLGTYLECVWDIMTLDDQVYNGILEELCALRKANPVIYEHTPYKEVDPSRGVIIFKEHEFPERIRHMAKVWLDGLPEPEWTREGEMNNATA